MTTISFRDYPYIPTLTAMDAELKAYKHLDDDSKKALLSVWTVGKHGQAKDVHQAAGKVAAAVGELPFVLHLDERVMEYGAKASQRTKEAYAQYNAFSAALLNPANGYANWRQFVASYYKAIPCLPSPTDPKEYAAAAKAVINSGSSLAFWVDGTAHKADLTAVTLALQGIKDPDGCLIIVDFGKVGDTAGAGARFAAIRQKLEQDLGAAKFRGLTFLATGTSFETPSETGLFARKIMELKLFDACGGYDATQYGDYGSVARTMGGGRWVGRVDYAKPTTWIMWRGKETTDSSDYVTGCKKIEKSHHMDQLVTWGTKEIRAQAKSDFILEGNGSPAHWISVRVNIHLVRQLRRAQVELSHFQQGDQTKPERPIEADPILLKLDK